MSLVFSGIHQEILDDETPELDVEGARLSGKTYTICEKIRRSCLKRPGIWWLMCRYSGTETDNQLRPVFMKVCRAQGTVPEWHDEESAYWFPEVDGLILKVFAFGLRTQSKDQRFAKIRGSGFAGVWNDQSEELPTDIGLEIRALLRQEGYPHQLIYSPNPPDEEHFLADLFPDEKDEPGRKLYRLSIYQNRHNLIADDIDRLEKAYKATNAKHKSLILGLRGPNITGPPVYDGVFARDVHFAKTSLDRSARVLEAIHFGTQHPVWTAAQRTATGIRFLGGLFGKRMFLEDFIAQVKFYREEWFPDIETFDLCCDPPPSDESNGMRYTPINILRAGGLNPKWRKSGNAPDVRFSVVQNIAGMMRRRHGQGSDFTVNADPARWLMLSTLTAKDISVFVTKETGYFIDGLEGSYVWSDNLVSVANKEITVPKSDQWVDGWQRCLENTVLNFCTTPESAKEKPVAPPPKMRFAWS